jgi:hypothetical protein
MSLHLDTLFWFRANQSLLFLLNDAFLVEKQQIPILHSFVWPDLGSYPQSIALEASTLTIMSCEKKTTAHSQNMLHMDVLHNIKRKKYKTVCAELAFTKSPSTEWSWFCIELVYRTRGEHANHYATDAFPYFFYFFFHCPSIYYLKTKINPKQLRVTWYLYKQWEFLLLIKHSLNIAIIQQNFFLVKLVFVASPLRAHH